MRRRALRAGLAVAVAGTLTLGTAVDPASAVNRQERKLFNMINRARARYDIRRLRRSDWLSNKAHRHSARMAQERRLFHHGCLTCLFGSRSWRDLGENVGAGPTVRSVHRQMMGSSGHRANILGRSYRRIGVGVVRRGGLVWVDEIFWG